MSIVISSNLVLSPAPAAFSANNPCIGFRNLVTVANIAADTEDPAFPVLNLANESTYQLWKGADTSEQYITIDVNQIDPIDYVGIAGHNFGTAGIAISIEGRASLLDPFVELVQPVIQADDSPYLGRFVPQSLAQVRIKLASGSTIPFAAVVYVGKLLVLQRRIYVGHRILNYNTRANVVTGMSEEGQFLGRIVLGEMTESALDLQNITPQFYRTEMEPWRKSAITTPFFFCWRPADYPGECGYCWPTGDMQVSNQRSNGMMQASLNLQGIHK